MEGIEGAGLGGGGIEGPSAAPEAKPIAGEALEPAARAEVGRAADAVEPKAVAAEARGVAGNDPGDGFTRTAQGEPAAKGPGEVIASASGAGDTPMNREQLLKNFDPAEGAKHLQSHAQRNRDFSEFKDLRTQAERQTAAQKVVEDILRDPRTAERANGPRFGNGSDFHHPDGRAVRFDGNGKFVGFLDTGTGGASGAPRATPGGSAPAGAPEPAPGAPKVETAPTAPGAPAPKAEPAPGTAPAAEPPSATSRLGRVLEGLGRVGGRLLGPLGTYLMFRDFQHQMEQMERQRGRDLIA